MARTSSARVIAPLLALVLVVVGVIQVRMAPGAAAATGAMVQPVSGYVSSGFGGCGGSRPGHIGIDVSRNNGQAIGAAYPGTVTVARYDTAGTRGNMVYIQHASGYTTAYFHMNSLPVVTAGQQVSQGQTLGYVGATGGNSSGAHLHFEVHRNGEPQNLNSAFPCGSTVAKGAPINWSFPDLAPVNAAPDRVAILRNDGSVAVKEALTGQVIEVKTGAAKISVDRDRIGVVSTAGDAEIKIGGLTESWLTVYRGAKDMVIDNDRIVILATDGKAWAKDGIYSSEWIHIASNVSVIDASDGRIGVIENGVPKVKEGALTNAWTAVANSATDLSLDGARLGIVEGGTAKVKEGPLNAGFVNQATGVTQVVVEGYRIGVRSTSGTAQVKDGALNAGWITVASRATDLDLAGDRVAVVEDGWAKAKEGGLTANWHNLTEGAKQIVLADL